MVARGRMLVRVVIVLLLVGMVTTDCGWIRRMRQTPRQRWWEFWRPPRPESDLFYPTDIDVTPPPAVAPLSIADDSTIPIEPVSTAPPEAPLGLPETRPARVEPRGMVNELQTVYFDFDRSDLKLAARRVLEANAEFLRVHPEIRVLIEGHCDERGTTEYNLHLGQRRADVVREFLVSRNVPAQQVETISFGEERPVDAGRNEAAWAKNRRAQFQIY